MTHAPSSPFAFSDPTGAVTLEPGMGGLIRAVVATGAPTAHLYLQGAHLTHYAGIDGQPVFFLSEQSRFQPGQPIRGGVPVVFPWFAAHPTDAEAPSHGVARTADWRLREAARVDRDTVALHLSLEASATGDPRGGTGWVLHYRVTVGPAALRMALTVEAPATQPLRCELALHTYLAVDDVRQVRVHGLEGSRYLDKTQAFRESQEGAGPVRLGRETDRVYPGHTGTVVVEDPGRPRRLRVDKSGSATTVLWNPGAARAARLPDLGREEWPRFVCVETACVGQDAVALPAGGRHTMEAVVSVDLPSLG